MTAKLFKLRLSGEGHKCKTAFLNALELDICTHTRADCKVSVAMLSTKLGVTVRSAIIYQLRQMLVLRHGLSTVSSDLHSPHFSLFFPFFEDPFLYGAVSGHVLRGATAPDQHTKRLVFI